MLIIDVQAIVSVILWIFGILFGFWAFIELCHSFSDWVSEKKRRRAAYLKRKNDYEEKYLMLYRGE